MKRIFTIIAACLFTFGITSAQDVEVKAKEYLPKQGDFAIGIDLKPVLKYVGNIFNGNTDNTIDYLGGEPVSNKLDGMNKMGGVAPDVSIMGKYMLTDNWAVRANVGMLLRTNTTNAYVQDDAALLLDPFNEAKAKLIDSKYDKKNGMSLLLGAEYRKGTKRVQGVFGCGLLLGFQNVTTTYKYANEMTLVNNHPTTAFSSYNGNYRITKQRSQGDFFYGATGSAGVEWFVAPKISLGAEVNLTIYGVAGAQQYTETEGYNTSTQQLEERCDLTSPGNNAFRFGTENVGGSLYMSFYF